MTTKTMPPKCGDPLCDEHRLVELADGTVTRCPRCHPLAPTSVTAMLERRARLALELAELDRAIAAAEAPDWARGPGARP